MSDISNNIKKIRKLNGMSQSQLADKLGVTRQTVSSWERGMSFPDIKMLEKLTAAFNIRVDELLYPVSNKRRMEEDKPFTLQFFFLSILIYSALLIWGGVTIGIPVLKKFVGGGIREEFIIVIYWGLILLVGFIVFCTSYITEHISSCMEKIIYNFEASEERSEEIILNRKSRVEE